MKETKREASKRATSVAKELGKGWRVVLWTENGEWKAQVFKGKVTIYPKIAKSVDPKKFGPGTACIIVSNLRRIIKSAKLVSKPKLKTKVAVNYVVSKQKAKPEAIHETSSND